MGGPLDDGPDRGTGGDHWSDEELAEAGDVEAMCRLAYVLGDVDPERAVYWDTRAAELGHLVSMTNLGSRLATTESEEAERWWLRATELGSAKAMSDLAWLYRESDPSASAVWRERAATAGHVPSMRWLAGQARCRGDRRTAIHWYERAAAVDDPRAMYWLAVLLDPFEVAFDLPTKAHKKAVSMLERSADLGDPYAQLLLARQLSRWDHWGLWTAPERVEEVRSLLHKAAEEGLPAAMIQLAAIAETHDRDPAESRRWLERAAKQGSVRAVYLLAAKESTAEDVQHRLDHAAQLDGPIARLAAGAAPHVAHLYRAARRLLRRRVGLRGDPVDVDGSAEAMGRSERYVFSVLVVVGRIVRSGALVTKHLLMSRWPRTSTDGR